MRHPGFCCLLCVVAAVVAGRPAQAQLSGGINTPETNANYINQALAHGKGHRAESFSGSSLLLPQWCREKIMLASGRTQRSWLKFDLAGQRLLWRRPAGDSLELETQHIREFVLTDSLRGLSYTYRRYLTARIEKLEFRTLFYEVRYDAGGAALLLQRVRLPVRGSQSPSLLGRQAGYWQEIVHYYLKNADDRLEPIELKPKDILAVLGSNHTPALKAYASREQLSLTTEAEVVKLLHYYDTLD